MKKIASPFTLGEESMPKKYIISVGWFFGDWAAMWSDNVIRGCTWETIAKIHLKEIETKK